MSNETARPLLERSRCLVTSRIDSDRDRLHSHAKPILLIAARSLQPISSACDVDLTIEVLPLGEIDGCE